MFLMASTKALSENVSLRTKVVLRGTKTTLSFPTNLAFGLSSIIDLASLLPSLGLSFPICATKLLDQVVFLGLIISDTPEFFFPPFLNVPLPSANSKVSKTKVEYAN